MAVGRINPASHLASRSTHLLDEFLGAFDCDKGIKETVHNQERWLITTIDETERHKFLVISTNIENLPVEKFLVGIKVVGA